MAPAKFLKTVQLDNSDLQTYSPCAQAGEWAVVGSFAFWDCDLEQLSGSDRQAFVHGFLGTGSFGWSTLVVVSSISVTEYQTVLEQLCHHLVTHYGAPDPATALPAAREETEFVAGLCEHEPGTLLAIQREFASDEIRENFKVIRATSAASHDNLRLWGFDDN